MIGTLTDDFETGIKVKEKIDKLKIVIHTENYIYIRGVKQVIYLYANEEIKEKHKKEMINFGLKPMDKEGYMYIYYDSDENNENNEKMLIPCQVYEKKIINSLF